MTKQTGTLRDLKGRRVKFLTLTFPCPHSIEMLVFMQSARYWCLILREFRDFRQFFVKVPNTKFHKIRPLKAVLIHTDRQKNEQTTRRQRSLLATNVKAHKIRTFCSIHTILRTVLYCTNGSQKLKNIRYGRWQNIHKVVRLAVTNTAFLSSHSHQDISTKSVSFVFSSKYFYTYCSVSSHSCIASFHR